MSHLAREAVRFAKRQILGPALRRWPKCLYGRQVRKLLRGFRSSRTVTPVDTTIRALAIASLREKDGERVRLWARTTSDYSKAFTRIRDAVAALPVNSAVLDGEAILLRADNTSDFEALRSRQGQAEAILVAYDIMEADGQDVRPEPLEERRKRLAKLLSRSKKALRDGIQLSEAITGEGAAIFRHACWMDLEGIVSKRIGSRYVSGRTRAWLKTKNPDFERR